jgi:hypothetical protein
LGFIEDGCKAALEAVLEAYEDRKPQVAEPGDSPGILAQSLFEVLDALRAVDSARVGPERRAIKRFGEGKDLSSLGNYGIRLLQALADWAARLGLAEQKRRLEALSLPLALWIAGRGGELSSLEPVVDSLAGIANRLRTPRELEDLYRIAGTLLDAVAPPIALDLDRTNPGRPWRVLVLNRAIIATRTHQAGLMEQAFRSLAELLPEDTPAFFREAAGQMDALDYPEPVRTLVDSYYQTFCVPKSLH